MKLRDRSPARAARTALAAASLAALFSIVAPRAARADATEQDGRLWAQAVGTLAFGEHAAAGLLVQARVADDVTRLERVLVSPWLEASLGRLAFALGYDVHAIEWPRDQVEHRSWEQVAFAHALLGVDVAHRLRLEQRFVPHADETASRLRYRLGLVRELGDGPLALELASEVFFALDARAPHARAGFDEARPYAGVRVALAEGLRLETGYQLQYLARPGRDFANHTWVVGIAFAR